MNCEEGFLMKATHPLSDKLNRHRRVIRNTPSLTGDK